MPRALIVYTTRTGDTQRIAERIAEGVRFGGMDAEMADVSTIKKETDLNGYDGLCSSGLRPIMAICSSP